MLKPKWLKLFLTFLPVASMGLVARAQAQEAKTGPAPLPAAKEELLGELPLQTKAPVDSYGAETQYNRFFFSPDRRRFAATGKTDKKKWVVVIDGKAGPEFEEVRFKDGSRLPGVSRVIFSPNGQHVAYLAHSGEDKWVVVIDGKAGPELECVESYDLPWSSSFSPDSEHFAYQAKRCPNKWSLVVDGKAGQEFSYVGDPLFSPDSQHVAYAARIGGGENACPA